MQLLKYDYKTLEKLVYYLKNTNMFKHFVTIISQLISLK